MLALTIPLCALLAAYARPVVAVVYGEKWLPAADAVTLLCVLGAARVALELGYDYLAAVGRTSSNLFLQGLWFLLLMPALAVGATLDGIRGVAAAHAVVALVVIVPVFLLVIGRSGIRVRQLARLSVRPVAAGVVVLASAAVLTRWLSGDVTTLLLGSAVSGLLALAVVLPMRRLVRPAPPQAAPAV